MTTHTLVERLEDIPDADGIISCLRQGHGGFVVQMPGGGRVQPEEIWLPALGCWVRANGSSVSADQCRGRRYFGPIDRWRIRRAADRFREMVERTNKLIARQALSPPDTDRGG